jgi:hypothetical protein
MTFNIKTSDPSKKEFTPRNPQKYVGEYPIIVRSHWERTFMTFLDSNSAITSWASESIAIPYIDPFSGKMRSYFPDFMIEYIDKDGKTNVEIIEIKPGKEAGITEAKSKYDQAALKLNLAKWKSATRFCQKHGIKFRVLTEQMLFAQAGHVKTRSIKRRGK